MSHRDPLNRKPFIARIQRISPDTLNGGQDVLVQWYYRPEDPGKLVHGPANG